MKTCKHGKRVIGGKAPECTSRYCRHGDLEHMPARSRCNKNPLFKNLKRGIDYDFCKIEYVAYIPPKPVAPCRNHRQSSPLETEKTPHQCARCGNYIPPTIADKVAGNTKPEWYYFNQKYDPTNPNSDALGYIHPRP